MGEIFMNLSEAHSMKTLTEYIDKRVVSPWAHYEEPGDVLKDEVLPISKKRDVLEAMKREDDFLMTATTENMAGGRAPRLQEIERALLLLETKEA